MAEQSGGGAVAHRGGRGSRRNEGRIKDDSTLIKGLLKFPTPKWYQFGLELNVPSGILKGIEHDYIQRGGVKQCLNETLIWWYNNTRGCATWGDICTALHAVEEGALAAKVAKEHGCSPFIVHHPESKNVDLGEKTVTFTCVADGTPPLQYSWKFNGEEMKEETNNTLTISIVSRKVAGKYECCVNNKFDNVTSSPAELIIGKEVTEGSMYDILTKSGVPTSDWLEIAKKLELSNQVLAGLFLIAWKESDATKPSWWKLARALKVIGGDWYDRASKQAEINAGHDFTLPNMCDTFKEVGIDEPDWQKVSSNLKLVLYGQVSVTELYEAWYKCDQSWEKLSHALGRFTEYQRVAKQAKKNAGWVLSADNVRQALYEVGIKSPDWRKIGEELGLQLRGRITAPIFFEGWHMHESKMSWEILAQALGRISGYESAAKKARERTGQKLNADAMRKLLTDTGIYSPDWEEIGNQLGLQLEGHNSAADFFDEWHAHDCKLSWMKLAKALEKIPDYQRASSNIREKQVKRLNADSIVSTFYEAGVHAPENWREIGQKLGLDLRGKLSAAEFFKGWNENCVASNKPSWENLAEALHKMVGYQPVAVAAMNKAPAEMSESNMCSVFGDVNDVDWPLLSQKLCLTKVWVDSKCLRETLKRWHNKKWGPWTTWRKLAVVAGSVYNSNVGQKLRQHAGVALKLNADNMSMVLDKAGIKEAADVASALGLSQSLGQWYKSLFGVQSWAAVLAMWKEQESYVSWSKLAEAVQRIHGVDSSQIILEISGEGECPTIARHPTNKHIAVGMPVVFECQATGAPPLMYAWMHNGIDLPAKNQRRLEFVVHQRSKGEYSCRVENEFGSSKSDPAMLTVGDFPKITSIIGEKHIKTGKTINIHCTATGEQPLKYSWWFSSVTPSTSSSAVLPNEDGPTLVITDAKEKDHQGFYQCRVKNSFGDFYSDFLNIKVGDPPTVEKFAIEGTTKISFKINEEVNFYCEANGTPPLHYVWLHNNGVIDTRHGNKLTVTAGEKTEGGYQCRVENLFGIESSEVLWIKVGDFPKITSIKGEKHIKTGSTINICCTATGEQPLKYTWWFSSVTPSTSSSTILPNEDGPNLVMTDAKEKDHQGFYQCHVTNCFGQVISDFLNIKVGNPPTVKKFAIEGTTKISFIINEEVNFYCEANGTPPLRYVWLHNNGVIDTRHGNKLTVTAGEKTEGEYQCRVENLFGVESSEVLRIKVGDFPKITSIKGEKHIKTGGTINICCTATGEPLKYTWWFSSVTPSTSSSTVLPNEDGPNLVITDAREKDHQGFYQCHVTNCFGQVISDFLNIKVGDFPKITSIKGEEHIKTGGTINICCTATGELPLKYTWWFSKVTPSTSSSTILPNEDGPNLVITDAREKDQGLYQCHVKNNFGRASSDFLNIKVGALPYIDVHPEIPGTVEPGDFLQLKCTATGKGSLHYVWQHENQTLVNETRPELIIKHVKESEQGEYKCCVTNAFGCVFSNPAVLKLSITQAELIKELAPHVAPRWYMFAVLLNISKPIVDRISRSFTVHGSFHCCLSEVVEAWLEEMNAATHKMTGHVLTNVECHRETSQHLHYWIQIYYVIERMGYMTLAQDLNVKHNLLAKAAGVNDEKSKAEVAMDANEMQQHFTELIKKVQPILATSDADPTATISTCHSAIDTSIGDCKAYLHLIDFSQEETNNISDAQSLLDFVVPYLDFQRFHILETIVGQFKSEKARESTQKYRDLLDKYQSQVNLGKFILAIVMKPPPANPPFMRPLSLQLESKWATCTIQDLENLLTQILPKSVGHIFVWFYKAHEVAHDNSICLDYIISPSIVEILKNEAERKQGILRSAGVLSISIDGTDFRPKDGASVYDGDHGGGGDSRSDKAKPPIVTSQPSSQKDVPSGKAVVFSVQATGTEPLSYQWQWKQFGKEGEKDEWQNLSGGSDTLQLIEVQACNAGCYQCVVSNLVGSETSQCASLTVAAELNDLMSELQGVNDWITMGLYLGIQLSKLEAIQVDCPTLGERRTQMLIEWQKKVVPTWSAVVQALVGIGMRRLASDVAQNHGIPPPKLSDIDPLCQLESTSQQEEEATLHGEIQQRRGALKQEHRKLLNAQECFKNSHELKEKAERKTSEVMTELKESHENMQKMSQEKRNLEMELKIKEQECEMLCTMQKKDVYNQVLQVKVAKTKKKIKSLKEELKRKESKLQSALQEIKIKQEQLLQARKEMKKQHKEVMQLQKEKEKLTCAYNIEKEQVSKLVQIFVSDKEETKRQLTVLKDESELKSQQIKASSAEISQLSEEIKALSNSLQEKEATATQLQSELQTHQQVAIPPEQLLKLTLEIAELEHRLQEAEYSKQQAELERRAVVREVKERERFKEHILVQDAYSTNARCSADGVSKICATGTEPTLQQLLRFPCHDERVINIPEEIGTTYVQFGIFLLDDRNGLRVRTMAHKHLNDAERINEEILEKWLVGKGKQPVTWATLVEVLRDIELSVLADDIEAVKCPTRPVTEDPKAAYRSEAVDRSEAVERSEAVGRSEAGKAAYRSEAVERSEAVGRSEAGNQSRKKLYATLSVLVLIVVGIGVVVARRNVMRTK